MEWLNYHHLLYFWTVVRTGGVGPAAKELRLSQPTVSAQVHALEEALGETLFVKQGRGLAPTEMGRLVFRYADEIFTLGRELQDVMRGRPTGKLPRLAVGIADALPKMLVRRLLEPAVALADPIQLVCLEGKTEILLAELAQFRLDLVLSDTTVPPSIKVKAYSHLLGETGITWFAAPDLAGAGRRRFPRSLDGAPVLLPTENTALRRALEAWFEEEDVQPRVVAEFEDSALLKSFGQTGMGLFCAPTAVESEVRHQYGVVVVGRTTAVMERVYAITVDRKLRHPAAIAISRQARGEIFRDPGPG